MLSVLDSAVIGVCNHHLTAGGGRRRVIMMSNTFYCMSEWYYVSYLNCLLIINSSHLPDTWKLHTFPVPIFVIVSG
jgi:hypothetical protein